jgi:ornithine carbamoyltransferase
MSTAQRTAARDLLRVSDLDRGELTNLLDLAELMRADPNGWIERHRGDSVACYFEKPSTRTRVSFEAAAHRLGMLPMMLKPDELQLGRGELISDTARVLSGFVSAIVMRTFSQDLIAETAAAADVPVVNALSDMHHPCQALADLLTIRDHAGRLDGIRLAYVGDGNNVAHSLMEAGALAGMDVTVGCPADYRPDPSVLAEAQRLAEGTGAAISVEEDPRRAVAGCDVVYTDVWVSMGQDAEHQRRGRRLTHYAVTAELMAAAADGAMFMHCLPAHRGEEVDAEVIDGPRSLVWKQAANRLPTEQAVLHALTTGLAAGDEQYHREERAVR